MAHMLYIYTYMGDINRVTPAVKPIDEGMLRALNMKLRKEYSFPTIESCYEALRKSWEHEGSPFDLFQSLEKILEAA